MALLLIGATLSIVGVFLWRRRGLPGAVLALAGCAILAVHFRSTREADRAPPSRTDFATPPPAAPLPATVAHVDPADLLVTLQDLVDEDATDGGAFGSPPGVSGSDVVGFWRAFTERLLTSGVRPEYVAALQSSYGTTRPRSFVAANPTTVAAELMATLNESSGGESAFLVTHEEAAALQQLAQWWLHWDGC